MLDLKKLEKEENDIPFWFVEEKRKVKNVFSYILMFACIGVFWWGFIDLLRILISYFGKKWGF